MTRDRDAGRDDAAERTDSTRGPDEAGIGTSSKSSPQGDGAERAATGKGRDGAGTPPADDTREPPATGRRDQA